VVGSACDDVSANEAAPENARTPTSTAKRDSETQGHYEQELIKREAALKTKIANGDEQVKGGLADVTSELDAIEAAKAGAKVARGEAQGELTNGTRSIDGRGRREARQSEQDIRSRSPRLRVKGYRRGWVFLSRESSRPVEKGPWASRRDHHVCVQR